MHSTTFDFQNFHTLADLRDWLNSLEDDLSVIFPDHANAFYVTLVDETLSDGSEVRNAIIRTA